MSYPDADRIRRMIDGPPRQRLQQFDAFSEIDSTSNFLLDAAAPETGRFSVAIADHQTRGRGRFDRRWLSPPGTGLCMSMAYTFARLPARPGNLTLAAGLSTIAALEKFGYTGLMLKWPNDLVAKDRKLAGILCESRTGDGVGATVVVGVGLNVDFAAAPSAYADRMPPEDAVDLRSIGTSLPDRNALASVQIEALFDCLSACGSKDVGLDINAWQRYDWLRGRSIRVQIPDGAIDGIASGVDDDGALLLAREGRTQRILAGSVTLNETADERP